MANVKDIDILILQLMKNTVDNDFVAIILLLYEYDDDAGRP